MAVLDRRNDFMSDDDEKENALFEEVEERLLLEPEFDTPLYLHDHASAAALDDVNALHLALENLSGSIDEPVEDGDTALHLTCLYGYLPCVQGAYLAAKDEHGALPLHYACAGGFTEIVQLLIRTSNDPVCVKRMIESVDAEGDTPLHHAARGEHVDVIRLLLSSGSSPTKTNIYGQIPSELADPGTEAKRILERFLVMWQVIRLA